MSDLPAAPRLFCSDASRQRGDDATATAARIDAWLLVECNGPWGRDPIRDAALPPGVRESLLRALKEIPRSRLLFIRRGDEGAGCRVYAVRTEAKSYASRRLDGLHAVADLSFRELLEKDTTETKPLLLVCTHGQHDSCCGRRGYPLFESLSRHEGLDIWQCSHVGGDRFAANVVVLPQGVFYGPVEIAEGGALIEAVRADEIFLDAFRGRSSMSRPAQAAEAFVRRATGIRGRESLHVLGREDLDGERVRVRFSEGEKIHAVVVEHYTFEQSALLTCGSKQADEIRQYRLVSHDVR